MNTMNLADFWTCAGGEMHGARILLPHDFMVSDLASQSAISQETGPNLSVITTASQTPLLRNRAHRLQGGARELLWETVIPKVPHHCEPVPGNTFICNCGKVYQTRRRTRFPNPFLLGRPRGENGGVCSTQP